MFSAKKMEKIQMCRICLAQNVRMFKLVNKNLQDLYEKLTDVTFITEDSEPILACFICCAQLKKCYRFQKKCLKAEEQFAKMMNEEYEPKPLINQGQFELFHGFIRTPIDTISIVDVDQTESIVVKEELPAVCERLNDIIETKKETTINKDLETKSQHKKCLEIEFVPTKHTESDSKDDVHLVEVKIEVEDEQDGSESDRKAEETICTPVEESKVEEKMTAEQTKTNQIRRHVGEKSYNCNICQRSFNLKHNLQRHTRLHAGEKPYQCDICQRSFNAQHNLTAHSVVHTGVKPFKCEICLRTFNQKNNLNRHVRIHTGEKPYKCDVCQRRFNTEGNFLKHNLVHSGVKPFKCDICQSSFTRKCHLKKHSQQHASEKPYKCEICQRSFSYKNNLKCHILIHTGEKPFKCNTCLKTFRHKNGLIKHIRTHTGEKPYKCDICQRSFTQSGTLARHIEKKTCVKRLKRKGVEVN